ncbi:chloride channel protein [Lacticaseibacillus jixianensis]|uniref:Chloride channel protein n=1 Tax=Lacticaseibacillus jixianensis TaxID=2486012 RepID=A0ABW4BAX3_9LACO|nr:chloride channel protein [Lacticaseibacillus jixianensis]
MLVKRIVIGGYGLLCSVGLGSFLGGFYLLQGTLIHLVGLGTTWRPVFNAAWLLLIGGLIYLVQSTTGQLPRPLGLIRADLAHTGTTNYRYLLLQLVIPALILTSGTSLGPEATLVSTTVLGGVWLAEKQRWLTLHWQDGKRAILKAMAVPHRALQPRPATSTASWWSPLVLAELAAGCFAFYLTCKFGGEPSVLVLLGRAHWGLREWAWLLPVFLAGRLVGRLELRLMVMLRRLVLGRVRRQASLLLLGGLAIYAASLWLPAINYSGMANFHLLAGSWQHQSATFLIAAALAKLALVTLCLNTGWIGGDIFPVLFCATAQGIALSQFLPADAVFVIAVFAISAGGTILEAPLVAGGVMGIMFLPPNLLGICALVTLGLWLADRKQHLLLVDWVHQWAGLLAK